MTETRPPVPRWVWTVAGLVAVYGVVSGVLTTLTRRVQFHGWRVQADPDIAWAVGLAEIALALALAGFGLLLNRKYGPAAGPVRDLEE